MGTRMLRQLSEPTVVMLHLPWQQPSSASTFHAQFAVPTTRCGCPGSLRKADAPVLLPLPAVLSATGRAHHVYAFACVMHSCIQDLHGEQPWVRELLRAVTSVSVVLIYRGIVG